MSGYDDGSHACFRDEGGLTKGLILSSYGCQGGGRQTGSLVLGTVKAFVVDFQGWMLMHETSLHQCIVVIDHQTVRFMSIR